MTLELLDDGIGLTPSGMRIGTGLRKTRQRLAHLYGSVASLDIASRPAGGTMVRVTLPFRREPDPLVPADADVRPAPHDQLAHAVGERG